DLLPLLTPTSVRRLLRRCLEKERQRRLDSAAAARLEIDDALVTPSEEPAMPRHRAFSSREMFASPPALVLLVACAVLSVMTVGRRTAVLSPAGHAVRSSILPPAKVSFVPSQFAISPDETQLAFAALDQDGRTALWLRALSGSSARRLDGTEDAAYPFWSPDGTHVGFFAARKLKAIELSTGIVRMLAAAPVGRGGAWGRD